jgi:hypothetical protein
MLEMARYDTGEVVRVQTLSLDVQEMACTVTRHRTTGGNFRNRMQIVVILKRCSLGQLLRLHAAQQRAWRTASRHFSAGNHTGLLTRALFQLYAIQSMHTRVACDAGQELFISQKLCQWSNSRRGCSILLSNIGGRGSMVYRCGCFERTCFRRWCSSRRRCYQRWCLLRIKSCQAWGQGCPRWRCCQVQQRAS